MINKQYNNTEINTEINIADITPEQIIINNNVSYFNIDILKFNTQIKFDLIYLDPPYETNRNFAISKIDNTGFSDNWDNDDYAKWINNLIIHLNTMLSNVGTLVFHISADNSFIVESILRTHFKKISKIHRRRCHGKTQLKINSARLWILYLFAVRVFLICSIFLWMKIVCGRLKIRMMLANIV
jgi:16S rRNA G966 N2-methylase RsmD